MIVEFADYADSDVNRLIVEIPGLRIEIVEGEALEELAVRILDKGKIAIVPSASNAVRIRTVRY